MICRGLFMWTLVVIRTISATKAEAMIFVADRGGSDIYMANFSGGSLDSLTFSPLPLDSVRQPLAVDYDPDTRMVYWTTSGSIRRGNIDGTSQNVIITGLGNPVGIALNTRRGKVFWTDYSQHRIMSANLNGSSQQVLIQTDIERPYGITVHPEEWVMFWTNGAQSPRKIERVNLEGGHRYVIVNSSLQWPRGLAFNADGSRIYWGDTGKHTIESAGLWGEDRMVHLVSSSINPLYVAVVDESIVWTDSTNASIGIMSNDNSSSYSFYYDSVFQVPLGVHVYKVTCPAGTVMTEYGSIAMFDNGAINSRANSTNATCPYYAERGGRPLEALCEGDYQSPSKWVIPQMNCGRSLTVKEILGNLKNVEVIDENAANIAEGLAAITAMDQEISQDDLIVAVDLLEQITQINSTDIQVTESVLEIADKIAGLPDVLLEDIEEEDSAPPRVVMALESQLAVVEVKNGSSSRFVETNIAAEVVDVTTEDINQGYTVFMSVTDTGESISDGDFQVREGDLTQDSKAIESQATLFIPSGLADSFSERRGRLVITIYRVPSLFQDKSLAEFNQNAEGFNRTVNSRIISASVNNEKVEDLREPVRIYFIPLNPNGINATCVFWDFDEKAWSHRGCETKSNDNIGRIECKCNHLTNFGILMDIYGGDALIDQEFLILEIISYIGCLMSVLGLVLTIFTYATNKKLRDRKPNQILLSLSTALLGLYIVFLVMISLDTKRDKAEIPLVPCSILAAFLQYFVLASISWMAVEGYNMYNLFVRVLNTYLPWFMRKCSLFAWGVPLLIVGVTVGASRQHYAQRDFCFLTFWPLIGGLLIPIGFVMIFNFFMYVRILVRLNKTVKGKQLNEIEKRQRLRRFKNAVCIMVLMGLTWSVGYLSIIQPVNAHVQGVFTFLNSLQGCVIFMLYCLRQPQVRRAIP